MGLRPSEYPEKPGQHWQKKRNIMIWLEYMYDIHMISPHFGTFTHCHGYLEGLTHHIQQKPYVHNLAYSVMI